MNSSLSNTPETVKTAFWLRATASLLLFTLLWPSYAAATSTLVQSPPFTPIDPPANVMLMLDDSGSMSGHTLPMPPDISLTTSTDPRLCNVAVTGYTTVESCGQVKLLKDSSNQYWVQEGNTTPVPLISDNDGTARRHLSDALIATWNGRRWGPRGSIWKPVSAEIVNGQRRILFENNGAAYMGTLHYWDTNTWTHDSASGLYLLNTNEWKSLELDFWHDRDGDGKFGDAPVEWFNRVAISGYGGDEAGNWAVRSFAVSRNDDWILRSPALNPLWYNPAVWYKPWNNNNKTGADAFPNALIGGTANGSVSSRPNNTQLTQRDMRRVPTGATSTSLNTTAGIALVGTGALGTWDTYPDPSAVALGRTVTGTLSGTTVRFKYDGMPLEHGATGIPYNSATAASDAVPLDLFMRPIRTVTSTGQMWRQQNDCTTSATTDSATKPATKRCYTRRNTCASPTMVTLTTTDSAPNVPAPPPALSCWAQHNCAKTAYTYSDSTLPKPADLSCWESTCRVSGFSSGTGPAPTTISCPAYRQTSCSNTSLTTGVNLTPLYCYRNCENNSWLSTATNPGATIDISCKRRDSNCNSSTSTYFTSTPTNTYCYRSCESHYNLVNKTGGTTTLTPATGSTAPSLPTCYRRAGSCGDTTIRYSDVTTLASGNGDIWCRRECTQDPRPWETLTVAPSPSAQCWNRARTECGSATPLWTTTAPSPLTLVCPDAGSFTATSQPYSATQYAVESFTRAAPVLLTVTDATLTRMVTTLAVTTATTVTPTSSPRTAELTNFTPSTGTTLEPYLVTVSAGSSVTGPHAERLTPARYYYWNGNTAGCSDAACISARKGNPANYVLVQIDRTRPATGTEHRYVIRDAMTGAEMANSPRNPGTATAQPGQCANGSWCTWEEEAQNFANWYAYYRNRMFSSIAVMAEAMSSMQEAKFQNLRIGYGRINYFAGAANPWNTASTFTTIADIDGVANPGALIRGVRPFIVGTPARQQFFDWLFSLAWSGATPNREAVDSAGRYFTRTDNKGPWGADPGTENTAAHIPCRRNFTLLATDGEWTNASVGQPLISATGPLTGSGSPTASDSVNGPAMTSDIDSATFTYQPSNYPQFTGGSSSQDRTLTDATVYYWNRDLRPDLANVVKPITTVGRQNEAFWQSMSTYIVGFGLFASMDNTTTRSAIAAGTSVTWPTVEGVDTDTYNSANAANRVNDSFRAAMASRGQFYTATTVESLSNAVKSTFEDLTDQSGSGGGVALPGSVINRTDLFFRPSYFVGKNTYGKLEAFKVSDMATLGGGSESPQWNASLPATRTVLTSTAATSATTFVAANLTPAQQTQIGGGDASRAGAVVSYLSGSTAQEIANGGTFRNRVSPFGTFVNSKPLYSKAPDFGYAGLETIGDSYKTFVNNNKANPGRTAAVYMGGNAGMFHAFRADTGVELFSYVPRGVYENLYALTQPGASHRYYVDGPVVQGDAYLGSSWKNIIVGTTGAGGASIFALDVTDPTAMTSGKVLFDVTKADNPTGWSQYLGHVLGTGVIGRIKTSTGYEWVYMVGNGVESTSNQAALLVISLSNPGSVTAIPVGPTWVSTAADAEAKRNGMGGINVVYGPQRSIVAVYGGDKQGNLWRFNFAEGIPTQAAGFSDANAALFTATDSSNKPQPITTAPVLYPLSGGRMVAVFGTGKLYDNDDPTNTSSQALYAVIYDPRSGLSSISKTELNTVTVTAGAFDTAFDDKRGWVLELQAGERVIANPTIANALISITTYTPGATSNVCLGGGSSRLVRINVLSSSGLIENLTAATAGSPSLHFTPRVYNPTDEAPPRDCNQKGGCTDADGGGSTSGSAQCHSTVLGVDRSTGQNTASCPQTPVMRVWRPLAR